MFRRVVSLLLLPCVLLTPLAAVLGHAHAGQGLPGHDLRPHVHTRTASHDHGHRHQHGHGHTHGTGGQHDHHDDADAPGPRTPTAPSPEPLSHHDSDAFYVAGVDVVAGGRPVVGPDLDTSSLWMAPAPGGNAWACRGSSPPTCRWHPPSESSCPLYVRHRTLLI
jgi:hypothetical protein